MVSKLPTSHFQVLNQKTEQCNLQVSAHLKSLHGKLTE